MNESYSNGVRPCDKYGRDDIGAGRSDFSRVLFVLGPEGNFADLDLLLFIKDDDVLL